MRTPEQIAREVLDELSPSCKDLKPADWHVAIATAAMREALEWVAQFLHEHPRNGWSDCEAALHIRIRARLDEIDNPSAAPEAEPQRVNTGTNDSEEIG